MLSLVRGFLWPSSKHKKPSIPGHGNDIDKVVAMYYRGRGWDEFDMDQLSSRTISREDIAVNPLLRSLYVRSTALPVNIQFKNVINDCAVYEYVFLFTNPSKRDYEAIGGFEEISIGLHFPTDTHSADKGCFDEGLGIYAQQGIYS